jgi:hypothetical protein
MNKQSIYLVVTLATLFLLGCGDTTDEINKKDKVIILHKVNSAGCLFLERYGDTVLKQQNSIKNISYSSKKNSVSCATYGKSKGDINSYSDISKNLTVECAEMQFLDTQEAFPSRDLSLFEGSRSCVIAFDTK